MRDDLSKSGAVGIYCTNSGLISSILPMSICVIKGYYSSEFVNKAAAAAAVFEFRLSPLAIAALFFRYFSVFVAVEIAF